MRLFRATEAKTAKLETKKTTYENRRLSLRTLAEPERNSCIRKIIRLFIHCSTSASVFAIILAPCSECLRSTLFVSVIFKLLFQKSGYRSPPTSARNHLLQFVQFTNYPFPKFYANSSTTFLLIESFMQWRWEEAFRGAFVPGVTKLCAASGLINVNMMSVSNALYVVSAYK